VIPHFSESLFHQTPKIKLDKKRKDLAVVNGGRNISDKSLREIERKERS
jgi:hypothetical protein